MAESNSNQILRLLHSYDLKFVNFSKGFGNATKVFLHPLKFYFESDFSFYIRNNEEFPNRAAFHIRVLGWL